jgi:hypothetical protein
LFCSELIKLTKKNILHQNIATVHNWLGIVTAILYFLNFLIGLVVAIFRDSITMEFRVAHQLLGMSAFLLTVVAIGSGIMHYQGKKIFL